MDSSDYEYIRNMTLMFFLDRLMDKGQPRSLHDLSCQFGTKGFTKEMRQIAGGSQRGLRKFLSQYPSLFTIEDDQVYITNMVSKDATKERRDYSKEAADYFRQKLEQYGHAEVPIKSLFGHRSQAPPEIRHVSGQTAREFKDFLCKNEDIYVVTDDYVVLKSVLEKVGPDGEQLTIRRVPEEVSIDPYLMQQLVNLLEDVVFTLSNKCEKKRANTNNNNDKNYHRNNNNNNDAETSAITLDELFNYMKDNHANELWSRMVNNTNDLCTLLKMNSKLFLVQSIYVSLTPEREQQIRSGQKNHSLLKLTSNGTNGLTNSSSPASDKHNNSNRDISNNSPPSQQNSGNSSLTPPRSMSPVSSVSPVSSPSRVSSAGSFQQRVRSQIMKALADNASMYKNDSYSQPHNVFSDATLLRYTQIVSKTKEGEEIVNDIINTESIVAIDCEGVNLGSSGSITLVEIAVMSRPPSPTSKRFANQSNGVRFGTKNVPRIYIFDVLFNPDFLSGCLKRLLEAPNVIKVFHDVRNDSSALYFQHGIRLMNVFDTQVAHSVLQQQNCGKPVYKSKFISLQSLCELYTGITLSPRKEAVKKSFRRDQKFWSHRPLTEDMIYSAVWDVYPLVPDVYLSMHKSIKPEYLELLAQLNKEAVLSKIKPEEVKTSKKLRKIDMEVTDLKQKLYNTESKQVILSNREIRLLRFIDMTEEIKAKIEGSQKVAKKLERLARKQSEGKDGSDRNANNLSSDSEDGESDDDRGNDMEDFDYYDQSDSESNQSQEMVNCVNNNYHNNNHNYNHNNNNNDNRKSLSPSESIVSQRSCCNCNCHTSISETKQSIILTSTPNSINRHLVDASIQTLSTGDIAIAQVYLQDDY
uniref:3'-5' exonuclease domain-containing protein n=1 Tax=Tetranychus urticae TaxID=32264 RepID=T1JWN7_TETUR